MSSDLEATRARAEATLKRVEALHNNLAAKDTELDWQQQYNAQILQQRVREELDKKQRFEELEKREAAREARARRVELAKEIETIRKDFRRLKRLKAGGPAPAYRCFMPFGRALHLEWMPSLDALLTVGSHGFLGVWKYPKTQPVPTERERKARAKAIAEAAAEAAARQAEDDDGIGGPCGPEPVREDPLAPLTGANPEMPTLVDYAELTREAGTDEDPHAVTTCCVCWSADGRVPAEALEEFEEQRALRAEEAAREQQLSGSKDASAGTTGTPPESAETGAEGNRGKDGKARGEKRGEWILVFSATRSGKGAFALFRILRYPEDRREGVATEEQVLRSRELAKLYEKDPAEAVRQMQIDLDGEGLRWFQESTLLVERGISNSAITACSFSATRSLVLTASQTSVRCFDMQLRNVWSVQLSTLLAPPSKQSKLGKLSSSRRTLVSEKSFRGPSGGGSMADQIEKKKVTVLQPLDARGSDFVVGLECGDLLLLLLPKEGSINSAIGTSELDPGSNLTRTASNAGGGASTSGHASNNIGNGGSGGGSGGGGGSEAFYSAASKSWLAYIDSRQAQREKNERSREANTINSFGAGSREDDSLLDGSMDARDDQIISTKAGVRVTTLAKLDVTVTCIEPLPNARLAVGCSDGQVALLAPTTDESLVFLSDRQCLGGSAGPVRSLVPFERGASLVVCDAAGNLRCFRGGAFSGFARCDDRSPQRLLKLDESRDRRKYAGRSFFVLAEDSMSHWTLSQQPQHQESP